MAALRQLMTSGVLAEFLAISERTVYRLNSSGKIPEPITIGSRPRWVLAEIEAWLAAGAPCRDVWDTIRPLSKEV